MGYQWAYAGGEKKTLYKIFIGISKAKISLLRPRRRWGHEIKFVVTKIRFEGVDWIQLAKDKVQ
jgi:hypothetical protein